MDVRFASRKKETIDEEGFIVVRSFIYIRMYVFVSLYTLSIDSRS